MSILLLLCSLVALSTQDQNLILQLRDFYKNASIAILETVLTIPADQQLTDADQVQVITSKEKREIQYQIKFIRESTDATHICDLFYKCHWARMLAVAKDDLIKDNANPHRRRNDYDQYSEIDTQSAIEEALAKYNVKCPVYPNTQKTSLLSTLNALYLGDSDATMSENPTGTLFIATTKHRQFRHENGTVVQYGDPALIGNKENKFLSYSKNSFKWVLDPRMTSNIWNIQSCFNTHQRPHFCDLITICTDKSDRNGVCIGDKDNSNGDLEKDLFVLLPDSGKLPSW